METDIIITVTMLKSIFKGICIFPEPFLVIDTFYLEHFPSSRSVPVHPKRIWMYHNVAYRLNCTLMLVVETVNFTYSHLFCIS